MLVKEYRIPLPLSVEEYRVAQLYMIAKKSREESQGTESGVEILVNEPYEDGPGGNGGQYTHKLYHVGKHLPALTVEEKAWNAYPYTKTRYTCPFVEKFYIEIETKYFDDDGSQENVFKLDETELSTRVVDLIDIVKDQLYGSDYVKEEDPTEFVSTKTKRGPLDEDWIKKSWDERKIMCAYKLCKVDFRYFGFQTKVERFVHDTALRRVMLRAHRQAWAWQDEWIGLNMDDIRALEKETQELLAKKMARNDSITEPKAEQSSDNKMEKSKSQGSSSDDEFVDAEGTSDK